MPESGSTPRHRAPEPFYEAVLGPVQKWVLLVLSTRGPSKPGDWSAFYPFRTEQVRGAIERLERRGWVDVTGWDRGRIFGLTTEGYRIVDLLALDEDELLDESDGTGSGADKT